jgi:DNA repair protein SbcC/Rad50
MLKEISDLLTTYFGVDNWEQLEGDGVVFKCQKKYNDEVYQKIYVDATGKWQGDDFNVETHLENYLLNDYYSETGFLQWNYYYYFIQPNNVAINSARKASIEENMTYARKYVLSLHSFEQWLIQINQIGHISEIGLDADLSTIWINYLREKKLIPIYNKNYYQYEGVETILNGNPQADIDTTDSDLSIAPFETINKIQQHHFTSNRKYPLRKDYLFKTVNLITGSNATGKTSLLTSIEILLTGKSNRSNSTEAFKINATHSQGELNYPAAAKIYKQRDKLWYSSGRSKGEALNENFTRYNYYSSDAAYDLEHNGKNGEPELMSTLQNIALGKEVNELETRIIKFKYDLDSACNRLETEVNDKQDLYDKNIKELELIRQTIQKPDEHLVVLARLLSEIGHKSPHDYNISVQSLIELESQFKRGKEIVTQIKELTNPSNTTSQSIATELRKLEVIEDAILRSEGRIDTATIDLSQLEKNKVQLDSSVSSLNRYYEYAKLPFYNSINGLSEKIRQQQTQLTKCQEINTLSLSIAWESLTFNTEEDIEEVKRQLSNTSFELQGQIKNQNEKIEHLQRGIQLLDKLVADIKSSGANYLSNYPEATECPLCLANYPVGDLLKRIEHSKTSFENSTALEVLKRELFELQENIEKNSKAIVDLGPIISLKNMIVSANKEKVNITQLQKLKEINQEQLILTAAEVSQLIAEQKSLTDNKMSEEELSNLFTKISALLKSNTGFYEIESEINRLNGLVSEINQNITNAILAKEDAIKDRSNELSKLNFDFLQLPVQIGLLKRLKGLYEEIEKVIIILGTDTVESVELKFEKGIGEIQRCKEAIENQSAGTIAEKFYLNTNKTLLDEITEVKRQLKNGKEACESLEYLIKNHGKNKYLEAFIRNNKLELINAFLLIHSPKEFSGLEIETNSIRFIRKGTDEKAKLSEISTGQRTALAVSIFLLLNKKLRNGPNIVLFDDPIAFVDDLNVLSFLDYLREIVIQSNKQIFFATANNDLAFLFKKKFEFLSQEFESFLLERDSPAND